MKIGLLVIATGKYKYFFDNLYKSIQKNFLPKHEKIIYYFTDEKKKLDQYTNVVQIYKEKLGFPSDTLYRYKFFNTHKEKILKYEPEYLFYLDVDMRIVDIVDEKIIPKKNKTLTCTFHPGFYNQNRKKRPKPLEDRKISSFFVPLEKRIVYFAGGFQGGETKEYLRVTENISKKIDHDFNKLNIIPKFHDESAWNHYILHNIKKFNVLKPEYCYPEMEDQQKFKELYNTICHMQPKILALEKDHKFYRS